MFIELNSNCNVYAVLVIGLVIVLDILQWFKQLVETECLVVFFYKCFQFVCLSSLCLWSCLLEGWHSVGANEAEVDGSGDSELQGFCSSHQNRK